MRQMQGGKGGAMGFGRSKAKMMNELKGKITFNDVWCRGSKRRS